MRRLILVLLPLVVLVGLVLRPGALRLDGESSTAEQVLAAATSPAERGLAHFAFGGWGGLSSEALGTSAQPWKLVNAALALQAAGGDPDGVAAVDLPALYRSWGFLSPDRLANWPDGLAMPRRQTPLGLNAATAGRLWPPIAATIGNIGCAACHSGVLYDAEGTPDPTSAWLGAPNTSINLQAWTTAVTAALRDGLGDEPALLGALDQLYPDTDWRERAVLRWAILPEVRARLAGEGPLLPFRASLAGATNGLDSLRNRLGLLPPGPVVDSVFNSVPDLGDRALRTRLLNTGGYGPPGGRDRPIGPADLSADHLAGLGGIVAFFTVPAMGVSPEVARAHADEAAEVMGWIASYRPQPFPGAIDPDLARAGQGVYARACAACHGDYDDSLTRPRLIRFPNWRGDVGTDPQRALLFTPGIARAVTAVYGDLLQAEPGALYAAPPLTGLWSSAPYLHNGSVPTLWHLMRPDSRPVRFTVGGHRLDMARIGIELTPPAGWQAWATPVEIDTRAFGLSAAGHEVGFAGLAEADRAALLEYLKLL